MPTETATLQEMVCSDKPRPSVQKGSKGHQFWRREVFHIRRMGAAKTLCGQLCVGWLVIGHLPKAGAAHADCCKRCAPRAEAV